MKYARGVQTSQINGGAALVEARDAKNRKKNRKKNVQVGISRVGISQVGISQPETLCSGPHWWSLISLTQLVTDFSKFLRL